MRKIERPTASQLNLFSQHGQTKKNPVIFRKRGYYAKVYLYADSIRIEKRRESGALCDVATYEKGLLRFKRFAAVQKAVLSDLESDGFKPVAKEGKR
jgi:hypothetical protein